MDRREVVAARRVDAIEAEIRPDIDENGARVGVGQRKQPRPLGSLIVAFEQHVPVDEVTVVQEPRRAAAFGHAVTGRIAPVRKAAA